MPCSGTIAATVVCPRLALLAGASAFCFCFCFLQGSPPRTPVRHPPTNSTCFSYCLHSLTLFSQPGRPSFAALCSVLTSPIPLARNLASLSPLGHSTTRAGHCPRKRTAPPPPPTRSIDFASHSTRLDIPFPRLQSRHYPPLTDFRGIWLHVDGCRRDEGRTLNLGVQDHTTTTNPQPTTRTAYLAPQHNTFARRVFLCRKGTTASAATPRTRQT
jgi:hypothetical protein